MNRHFKTDTEIIEAIRMGGDSRLQALRNIFMDQSKRNKAIRYLKSRGCTLQDAEDLYHDAMIIFDSKASAGEFVKMDSIEAYMMAIVKHGWYNKYRKNRRQSNDEVKEDMLMDVDASAYYERQERGHVMKRILTLVGERCQQLLLMFTQGYAMTEIADRLNMQTDVRVRKEKYRCLNRIRLKIQNDKALSLFIKSQLTSDQNDY